MTTERIKAALTAAKATRGPRKGFLKAKCPPMGTDAAIAWQAAMLVVNPYKVSIGQMLFMDSDQREFFDAVTAHVEAMHSLNKRTLDKDRMQLSAIGVW